jgi:phenylalanyl-tRNA synthetase alpha chain
MNITQSIIEKNSVWLHNNANHPLGIIKDRIYSVMRPMGFDTFDNLSPIVTVAQNFDELLVPADHVCRQPTDTYYLSETRVLRTHTSAHQVGLLREGCKRFMVTGDVFRRDEIDRTHYPVFHQMEGVCVFENTSVDEVIASLQSTINAILDALFPDAERRWVDSYFPFTNPSWEVEVFFNGKWLEVLGCGVIEPKIIENAELPSEQTGWAFGLGLERLAMVLFEIPDIRLFWTDDKRFTEQFKAGEISKFVPFSSYPAAERDIAFWVSESFNYNDFCDIVRSIGGDLIESIALRDTFTHPTTHRVSNCYRIVYQSMVRTLEGDEIQRMHEAIGVEIEDKLGVEVRRK